MTTAFQSNAFQNNAFQIDAVVPPAATVPSGGGGRSKRRERARTINFRDMYEFLDEINARTLKERKDALRRLDKTIEDLVNGVKEEAKEVASPVPAVVTQTAKALSGTVAAALAKPTGRLKSEQVAELRGRLEQLERQARAAIVEFEARARERELEEDDEDVMLLLM